MLAAGWFAVEGCRPAAVEGEDNRPAAAVDLKGDNLVAAGISAAGHRNSPAVDLDLWK